MSFRINERTESAGGRTGTVYELCCANSLIEVWPMWGFNCLKWLVSTDNGDWADLLYTAPDWAENTVPTRSGHPILFPFPGRLKGGEYEFEGITYQLPLNDSAKENAIHGFTPRNPWRVVDQHADEYSASLTGEFCLSVDLPKQAYQWPDFVLRVTYEFAVNTLSVHAEVRSLDQPLPFGIGYHPYFRALSEDAYSVDQAELQTFVSNLWQAKDGVPDGTLLDIPKELQFNGGSPLGEVELDHGFVEPYKEMGSSLLARLSSANDKEAIEIITSEPFNNLVLFTPPHRKAIAIEPYTCPANAANLTNQGIDCGWLVLPPHSIWKGAVEYRYKLNGERSSFR